VVAFAAGPFSIPILQALRGDGRFRLALVVSLPDRPAGRGLATRPPPAAAWARGEGIALLQPERPGSPEAVDAIARAGAPVAVLADFGRIIPAELLAAFPRGILNVHPSLLPRHRGAAPIAATILAGDREAGVSIILLDELLDHGPILAVRRWPLRGDEIAPELEARAAAEAAALLPDVLAAWLEGAIAPVPQDETQATSTRPLRREDGRLDPRRPAAELERRVRAFQPWPGTYLETPAGRVLVWRAQAVPGGPDPGPGSLVADGDGIALVTSDGHLRLLEVQPAGGRRMSGAAFRRGRPALLAASHDYRREMERGG
jgi:methionyl-tRNA formyltransferase